MAIHTIHTQNNDKHKAQKLSPPYPYSSGRERGREAPSRWCFPHIVSLCLLGIRLVRLVSLRLVEGLAGAEAEAVPAVSADELIGILRLTDAVDVAGTTLGAEIRPIILVHHDKLNRLLVLNSCLVELCLANPVFNRLAIGKDDIAIKVLNNLVRHND